MKPATIILMSGIILSLLVVGCAKERNDTNMQLLQGAEKLEGIMEAVENAEQDPAEPQTAAPAREITDEDVGYRRINIRAYSFAYEPDKIEVELGERVMLTVTNIDAGHGFALPDFGINERIDAEESRTFTFTADKKGEFRFFNPVQTGDGWKDMEGIFIVQDMQSEVER